MDAGRRDAVDSEPPRADAGPAAPARDHRAGKRAVAALFLSVALHGAVAAAVAGLAGGSAMRSGGALNLSAMLDSGFLVSIANAAVEPAPEPKIVPAAEMPPQAPEATLAPALVAAAPGAGASTPPRPAGVIVNQGPARYFKSSELDTKPIMMSEVSLDQGIDPKATGYLLMRLYISETGEVERVAAVVRDAPEKAADEVMRRLGELRFTPGIKNHAAVKSQMLIEIKLRAQAAK